MFCYYLKTFLVCFILFFLFALYLRVFVLFFFFFVIFLIFENSFHSTLHAALFSCRLSPKQCSMNGTKLLKTSFHTTMPATFSCILWLVQCLYFISQQEELDDNQVVMFLVLDGSTHPKLIRKGSMWF